MITEIDEAELAELRRISAKFSSAMANITISLRSARAEMKEAKNVRALRIAARGAQAYENALAAMGVNDE